MSTRREATILLVKDDPGHARLIEKNLRRSGVTYDIVMLGDGQRVLDYLGGEGQYEGCEPARPLLTMRGSQRQFAGWGCSYRSSPLQTGSRCHCG